MPRVRQCTGQDSHAVVMLLFSHIVPLYPWQYWEMFTCFLRIVQIVAAEAYLALSSAPHFSPTQGRVPLREHRTDSSRWPLKAAASVNKSTLCFLQKDIYSVQWAMGWGDAGGMHWTEDVETGLGAMRCCLLWWCLVSHCLVRHLAAHGVLPLIQPPTGC